MAEEKSTPIKEKKLLLDLQNNSNENSGSLPESPLDNETKYDFCAARMLLNNSNGYPSNTYEYLFNKRIISLKMSTSRHGLSPKKQAAENCRTICESMAYMLNIFFGGGIFAMHVAFYSIGLTSAIIGLVCLAVMVGFSMCSLIESTHKIYNKIKVPQLSYPDLVENVVLLAPWCGVRKLSRFVRYLVEIMLILFHLGSCMVYQIFIARNLEQLVEGSNVDFYTNRTVLNIYVVGLIIPCLMVAMVRHLKYLAPFTLVINLYASMAAIVTIYYGVRSDVNIDLIPSIKSTSGLFKFIGISLFCLGGISVSLPIEHNMAHPINFRYVVLGSLPYATSVMMIIGIFGFGFGDKSAAPITIHFPWTHFSIMTKVFLCITVYITYAEIFYFGFDIQWYYLKRLHSMYKWWLWERLYRAINVILITLLACGIPNVCNFMAFLGCFCVSVICFILPAFIKLGTDWQSLRLCPWRITIFIVILSFGFTLIIAGSYYSLYDNLP